MLQNVFVSDPQLNDSHRIQIRSVPLFPPPHYMLVQATLELYIMHLRLRALLSAC
jgi:hypothetical protein